MATLETNELHYGDNLEVRREKIPDEIADLVYLDPPLMPCRSCGRLSDTAKGSPSWREATKRLQAHQKR